MIDIEFTPGLILRTRMTNWPYNRNRVLICSSEIVDRVYWETAILDEETGPVFTKVKEYNLRKATIDIVLPSSLSQHQRRQFNAITKRIKTNTPEDIEEGSKMRTQINSNVKLPKIKAFKDLEVGQVGTVVSGSAIHYLRLQDDQALDLRDLRLVPLALVENELVVPSNMSLTLKEA